MIRPQSPILVASLKALFFNSFRSSSGAFQPFSSPPFHLSGGVVIPRECVDEY